LIRNRSGIELSIHKIAIKDISKKRTDDVDKELFTDDAESVINDPNIDIIVELIGGLEDAKKYVNQSISNGKPVVTANKALLAHYGYELTKSCEENHTDIFFEAGIGGGIPIVKSLREGLVCNRIHKIYGILNGTCNYILTRMEQNALEFDDVLLEAQKLGYAEADPSLDIDGWDTAHKTCILASLAYGEWFDMSSIHVEGIRDFKIEDIRNAEESGYKIKLIGIIKSNQCGIELRVHPTLIPAQSLLSKVDGVYNSLWVRGDVVGETMYYGQGAGADATASSVIADIVDVSLNLKLNSVRRVLTTHNNHKHNRVIPIEEIESRYYIRLSVDDKPDVLAGITHVFGEADISIASIHQKEVHSDKLPIILITHEVKEVNMNNTLEKMERLSYVHGKPIVIRIEDL
jgi:homoserine dehydrogenase